MGGEPRVLGSIERSIAVNVVVLVDCAGPEWPCSGDGPSVWTVVQAPTGQVREVDRGGAGEDVGEDDP
jgi:hypothetical protein